MCGDDRESVLGLNDVSVGGQIQGPDDAERGVSFGRVWKPAVQRKGERMVLGAGGQNDSEALRGRTDQRSLGNCHSKKAVSSCVDGLLTCRVTS